MTRWGDLLERKRLLPTTRYYVARATDPGTHGIGTIQTPSPSGIRPVIAGDVVAWAYADEPVLLEGATVELLGPMTEVEAASTAAGMATERYLQAVSVRRQAADDARTRARLILTGGDPFARVTDEQVAALAEVIFWARGYDGQELPE